MRLLKARVRQHYKEIEDRERESKLAEKKRSEWEARFVPMFCILIIWQDHRLMLKRQTPRQLDADIDMFISISDDFKGILTFKIND